MLAPLRGMRRNIAALYGAQAARYVLPLILLPFLARVLGPDAWGVYSLGLAMGMLLAVLVEFGFDLSATRDLAKTGGDPATRGRIFVDVTAAKLALSVVVVGLALAGLPFYPALRGAPAIVGAALALAITQGLSPLWYFVGVERLRVVAFVDIGGKLVGVLAVLALVRSPADAALALALQAVANIGVLVVGLALARRDAPWPRANAKRAWDALRRGSSLFLFRAAVSLYTLGNALVLGFFAPAASVGVYAAAERIARSATNVTIPVSQATYPRISRLVAEDAPAAARVARASFLVAGALAVVASFALFAFAPAVVALLMGPGYDGAVPVLRWLAFLPPLLVSSNLFGIQWMLPHGMDRPFNVIILAGGAMNLALAVALAPSHHELGMAVAALLAETLVTFSMFAFLRRRGADPFGKSDVVLVKES